MRVRSSLFSFALLLTGCASSSPARLADVVDLTPSEPPAWSLSHLHAPVSGLFLGGPRYWYAQRVIDVETTPPDATLDLTYVRQNLQKRYQRAEAPARVLLPPRIEANRRDVVAIRVLLGGHREREIEIAVRGRDERVLIDLEPVPNALESFSHRYFGGRGSLEFRTRERLVFRVQRTARGLQIVLTETASMREADEMLANVQSSLVDRMEAHQIGADLVVDVALTDRARSDAIAPRYRQSLDPVRGLHIFSIELVSEDLGASEVERQRAALARLSQRHMIGCSLAYDRALRAALDAAALARAIAASGSYPDAFLHEAMRRLGEISPGGRIRMVDGRELLPQLPIELMAAATQASEAIGYLALLRTAVAELEEPPSRRTALQGLIAPELSAIAFHTALDRAEAAERACAGSDE